MSSKDEKDSCDSKREFGDGNIFDVNSDSKREFRDGNIFDVTAQEL